MESSLKVTLHASSGRHVVGLGIESTAHTFGASVVRSDGKILSDVKAFYKAAPGAGIHPREAARHHAEAAPTIIEQSLKDANTAMKDIQFIAFSAGPGLGPALRTGATVARALSVFWKIPLIPIHHAIGHIEIGCLSSGAKDPLVILTSGGHTSILSFAGQKWRICGETEDLAIGNLLDQFARQAGLPNPGGVWVERLAQKSHHSVDLPYTVKGNNVSYSGLLTAALKHLKNQAKLEDLCFSLQEVAFAMLTEVCERVLAHTEKKQLLLTGGVAANRRLQEMLKDITNNQGSSFHVVEPRYCGDCGAQIAWTGLLAYTSGIRSRVEQSYVKPRWRLDEVPIPWRSSS